MNLTKVTNAGTHVMRVALRFHKALLLLHHRVVLLLL